MNARRCALVWLAICLAGCFPDADKLRTGGSGSGATGAIGAGASGGSGLLGGNGGSAGIGGTAGTAGTAGTGGGTGGTGTPPPNPDRVQLCADYGMAVAAKSFACAPFLSAFRFGSPDDYAARLAMNCVNFDLPGVRFPPTPVEPCLIALDAQPCDQWIDGDIVPECRFTGSLAAGATCATGLQCSTDLCDLGSNGCGRCITAPAEGQACSHGVCAYGLECSSAGVCVTPGALGATCSDAAPCRPSLGCHAGTCAMRAPAGAACANDSECDIYRGSLCNQGLCIGADIGPTWGANPDNTVTLCGGGAICRSDGSCLPPAADGAACAAPPAGGACATAPTAPACAWPAVCASDGHCRFPAPVRTCGSAAAGAGNPRRAFAPAGGVGALWRGIVPRPDRP
jgi:hypothetical protein